VALFGGPPDIGKLKSKRNFKGLAKALRDDDPAIRAQAAQAIGELKDVEAVPPVVDAIEGQDEQVIQAGTEALRPLGDAAHLMLTVLAVHKRASTQQRLVAVDILARLGRRDMLEELTETDFPEVSERARQELQARGGAG
jgi:HEAT repeat protein